MEELTNQNPQDAAAIADITALAASAESSTSTGFSATQAQQLDAALDRTLGDSATSPPAPVVGQGCGCGTPGCTKSPPTNAGNFSLQTSMDNVTTVRQLGRLRREFSFIENLGRRGDFMSLGGGDNVAIGSSNADVIDARGGRFNTITSGTGRDTIVLGVGTTSRIFDFDTANDRLVIDPTGLNLQNLVLAQGKNAGRAGVDQPLDSANNAMLIDKSTGHILATMSFTKADQIFDDRNLRQLTEFAVRTLDLVRFDNVRQGDGQVTGTRGRDRLTGGAGNDFLYVGDDGFKFNTAKGGGGTEFPFATDSPGTSELNAELKSGVLRLNGKYQNFDASPLFSQGETEIDPKARILNGSNPQALVQGFLSVPKDVEGNPISGTHLHFSPAGDSRGNFADATVVRFLENTPTDAKSGTLKGEFELTPVEQAALLAGNMYVNIHTNLDTDGDGRAGFPTGENRINFNRNVVQFT